MKEKEVIVGTKTYKVRELLYKDIAKVSDPSQDVAAKKLMQLSTGMSDEEYENLSLKDGIELQKVINELNGFSTDFQKVQQ